MNLLFILLQDTAAKSTTSQIGAFLPLILIFVVFYFFMIRPQNKKQKEIKKAREALKKGDNIVTSGGVYGKICDVKDDLFVIEIADNIRIKVEKGSVFAVNSVEKDQK